MIDIDAFKWRLAETMAWCAHELSVADPRNSLRTHILRPPAITYNKTIQERQAIVETLAHDRVSQLHWKERWGTGKRVKYPSKPAEDLSGGRILLYDPDGELADGAAEVETDGFFNAHNEPPWDTWLCFVDNRTVKEDGTGRQGTWKPYDSYLVTWIPPQFIELADRGINVNPELCICWATDLDTPFTHQLKEAGLLG